MTRTFFTLLGIAVAFYGGYRCGLRIGRAAGRVLGYIEAKREAS